MKSKIAFFDMDGTLFDTCLANYEAYKYAVEESGRECIVSAKGFANECFGKNYKEFLPRVFNIPESVIEEIHIIKCDCYPKLCNKYVRVNDFLFDVIDAITNSYYIVMLTTASRTNAYSLLEAYGKKKVFDLIITASDVNRLKPDMEGVDLVLNKYGIAPQDAIMFDDSVECIVAAKKYGMHTYKVDWGRIDETL